MYKYNPKVLHYLISFECNQKCSKCSHWKFKYYEELLDIELFIKNLPMLKLLSEICIVGGEPLISKNKILKILSSISPNVRTVIVTNGVLLNKNLIRYFSKYNVHFVVSIDTLERDFWNFVRGSDSFDKVINNVEYARRILSPEKLSIQSVLSEETKSHVSEVAKYAKKLGVYHSIQPYILEGFKGSWTPIKLENESLEKNFEKCYSAGRNLSIMPKGGCIYLFSTKRDSGL